MKHVDIYITNTAIHKREDNRYYAYAIIFTRADGKSGGKIRCRKFGNVTKNEIVLVAMRDALQRMTEHMDINIYNDSAYVTNMIRSGTTERWKENGFHTANGKYVKSISMWKGLLKEMDKHTVNVEYVNNHLYSTTLYEKIRRYQEGAEDDSC